MNYLLIEERAWKELTVHAQRMADELQRLNRHFNPAGQTCWIDRDVVCQWLNISPRTLQYYRDSGVIPYTTLGRKCYYKAEDLKTLLDGGFMAAKKKR